MIALGIDTPRTFALVSVPRRHIERPSVVLAGELDSENPCATLAQILRGYSPEVVGIECPDPREGWRRTVVGDLLRTCRIAGNLENECAHYGITPHIFTASIWRKAVMGRSRPPKDVKMDDVVAKWIALFVDCQFATNPDKRDAIGVAIYAARHAAIRG